MSRNDNWHLRSILILQRVFTLSFNAPARSVRQLPGPYFIMKKRELREAKRVAEEKRQAWTLETPPRNLLDRAPTYRTILQEIEPQLKSTRLKRLVQHKYFP